jgi:pyruvate dehydrogenase E2 component (dihydrolipoamide acetyltransferase)
MSTNVIMPALGVAQQRGTLLKWLKAEGQAVSKGEPLMEVETDKATVEIEAPASGVLSQVSADAGDEVPVGQRIALILAPGESPLKITTLAAAEPRATMAVAPALLAKSTSAAVALSSTPGRKLASPAAKRLAREKGIALAMLRGSGPEGSILAADVLQARGAAPIGDETAADLVASSPMRRIVGARMTESKQRAPHFYLSMDIDMSAVSKLRSDWKDRGDETIPSVNDFILLACARALKDFPSMNSSYTERGIKIHAEVHIGMAVALDEGLVVPVIRNADRLGLAELAGQTRNLAEKAQNKKLLPRDYEGGTFTASNLGMLGVDSFTAIINPPQCAILAVGRVAPRVAAEDGMVAIKSFMTATLSADHRVVDGAIAARFLTRIKRYLESAEI